MFFAHALAIGLLVSAPGGVAPDNSDSSAPTAFTNHPVAPSPKPDRASLTSGSRAPDFQYQSYDAMWQHLHNVLEHGDVLLVFGCSDLDLRMLERERETLVKGGVLPLAVVERNDREVWASVRRLGLTYSLLADPRGAIGMQYGVFDAGLGRSRSAWFVIDTKGKVRQSGTDMPTTGWVAIAGTALNRPLDGGTQSASHR